MTEGLVRCFSVEIWVCRGFERLMPLLTKCWRGGAWMRTQVTWHSVQSSSDHYGYPISNWIFCDKYERSYNISLFKMHMSFPGGTSGKEPTCQCRRCKRGRFNTWVGKIPWRWKWQPTPIFLPGKIPWTEEPDRLQSIGLQRVGHDWSDLALAPSSFFLLMSIFV